MNKDAQIKYLFLSVRFLSYIILASCFFKTNAQQLLFNNISSQLPMPSQVCYNIMQDSKGYIWFSTEAGLCKYSGQALEVFDKKNGLPEGAVYCVKEDNKGVLWIATSKNRILNYKDSLTEADFSKIYTTKYCNKLDFTYLINFCGDEIYLNTQRKTIIANGKKLRELFIPDTTAYYYLIRSGEQLVPISGILYATLKASEVRTRNGYVKIVVEENGRLQEVKIPHSKYDYPYWRGLTARASTQDFFSYENKLVCFDKELNHNVIEYPDMIIALYTDKDNGLWVGLKNKGCYYYPDVKNMQNAICNLSNLSVSGICEDREKGIWFSTLEKGIFYCRNKNVISYTGIPGFDKLLELLKCESGKLFVCAQNNIVQEFDHGVKNTYEIPSKRRRPIVDMLKINSGWYIASKINITETDEKFRPVKEVTLQNTKFNANVYRLCKAEDKIFGINHSTVFEVLNNKAHDRFAPLASVGKCIEYIGNNAVMFGCEEGLYKMGLVNMNAEKIEGINTTVTDIIRTKKGEILVSTKGEGVFAIKNSKAKKLKELETENIEICFDIAEDRNGTIWMATNRGIVYLDGSAKILNSFNGLPGNEMYKVACDSLNVYCSGVEGLCSFPLKSIPINTCMPGLYLKTITVNGKPFTGGSLEHNENTVSINFDALTFKNKKLELLYVLNGKENRVSKEGNELTLENLDPGTYSLTLYVLNNDGVKSAPLQFNFEIKKPFWSTIWFIGLSVLFGGALVFIIMRFITKRIKTREEEKTRINKLIADSQLTALQAQMNPHFIFNAINSIQRYVLQKDPQQAYDYLAKFSKLIRMVLHQSNEKTISLKDELEMLRLYVELEQVRFDNKFEFKLTVDEKINETTVTLPSMLIQPYVENAIWHGLMNLDKDIKGELNVKMILEQELLKIVVQDNGVGRDKSQKYKGLNGHKAVGMKLTQQRLQMINQLKGFENSSVEIFDLYNEKGEADGTKVEILILLI